MSTNPITEQLLARERQEILEEIFRLCCLSSKSDAEVRVAIQELLETIVDPSTEAEFYWLCPKCGYDHRPDDPWFTEYYCLACGPMGGKENKCRKIYEKDEEDES